MTTSEAHRATADRLDQREARAMVEADVATLRTIWDDRLIITPPGTAPADKDTALHLVAEGVLAYRVVRREIDHVVGLEGVMLTMGRESVSPVAGGGPQIRRYTHVWIDDDGDWRLVARHASPASGI